MAKPMVLVVDDQPEYARLISLSLKSEGFEVRTASGGEEAVECASELHPDVVLLDVHMPGLDGFEVMAELRLRWPVPIIMVTGDDQLERRKSGLDRGADDYLTKPFAPPELAARVRALLRRSRHAARGSTLDVDPRRRLSRRATRLLDLFRAHPDRVLYHDELLAHAFGPAFVGDIGLLHEEIRRLRRGLGVAAGTDGPIRTIRGIGYVLDARNIRPARTTSRWLQRPASKAVGRA